MTLVNCLLNAAAAHDGRCALVFYFVETLSPIMNWSQSCCTLATVFKMTSNLKTCGPVGVRCPIDLFSHHRIFGYHFLSTFGHQERRWPYVGFPGISLELFYHHQAKMRILLQTGLRWLSLQLVVGFFPAGVSKASPVCGLCQPDQN